MKIEKIEKYLEEVSEGTDFSFTVEEKENKELTLYMQGDIQKAKIGAKHLQFRTQRQKRN